MRIRSVIRLVTIIILSSFLISTGVWVFMGYIATWDLDTVENVTDIPVEGKFLAGLGLETYGAIRYVSYGAALGRTGPAILVAGKTTRESFENLFASDPQAKIYTCREPYIGDFWSVHIEDLKRLGLNPATVPGTEDGDICGYRTIEHTVRTQLKGAYREDNKDFLIFVITYYE